MVFIQKLLPVVGLNVNGPAIKVLEISTEYAAKENSEIEVYLTDSISASETRYFVRNKESITSSFSNYFIEISAWTYRNLLPSAVM